MEKVKNEKIEELIRCWTDDDSLIGTLTVSALRELQQLRKAEGWVKTSDELPPVDLAVDALLDGDYRIVAMRVWGECDYSYKPTWYWSQCTNSGIDLADQGLADFEGDDIEITHWRRLPAAPKEGE